MDIPLLGEVPLEQVIRENADTGTPIVTDAEQMSSQVFQEIARSLVENVELRNATSPATQKIDLMNG